MDNSQELDKVDERIHKILAKFDEIKAIDDKIRGIMDKVPPALSNLKHRIEQNKPYFMNPVLSERNHKLSFSFYSVKFEITAHINLNTSPEQITQGVLRTSVYDESQKSFVHNPAYDMTIDENGKIDKEFSNDDWAEHYFNKVIWDFYNKGTEITFG